MVILGIHYPVCLIYHIAYLISIEVVCKLWNRDPIAFKSALRRVQHVGVGHVCESDDRCAISYYI